jgi:ABC-type transport system substrate-binding protein
LLGAAETLDLVAGAWRSIGISVTERLAPTQEVFGPSGPLLSTGRFNSAAMNAVIYTWTNAPDPDDSAYWQSSQIASADHPAAGNFVGYRDATVDRLTAAGQAAINLQARTRIYQQLQLQLARAAPAIFLAWPDILSLASAALQGYQPNPNMPAATWNAAGWRLASRTP